MAFKKGEKRPETAGRKAGTPNKIDAATREWVAAFLNRNDATTDEDFKKLEPAERMRIRVKLLEFVVPKQRAIEHSGGLTINWHEEKTYQ